MRTCAARARSSGPGLRPWADLPAARLLQFRVEWDGFSGRPGRQRGAAAAASHGLSLERLFRFWRARRVMEQYEPQKIEPKWQQVWAEEDAFHVPNPSPGEETERRHWYQLE